MSHEGNEGHLTKVGRLATLKRFLQVVRQETSNERKGGRQTDHVWASDHLEIRAQVAKGVIRDKLLRGDDLQNGVPSLANAERLGEFWPCWKSGKKIESSEIVDTTLKKKERSSNSSCKLMQYGQTPPACQGGRGPQQPCRGCPVAAVSRTQAPPPPCLTSCRLQPVIR